MIKPHRIVRKAAVAAAGFVLIIAGLLLLVLPGPGLLVIALGLFVLSFEFTWADKYYQRLAGRAEKFLERLRKKF